MIKIIKKIIPYKYHNSKFVNIINEFLRDIYNEATYSQEGEDRILLRIFENTENGFYVDIGAHHPKRFSNTYIFYKKGWKGINVDAMAGSMIKFNRLRPKDINIEAAISDEHSEINYYSFKEAALNTIDERSATELQKNNELIDIIKTKTRRLSEILDKHLPPNQTINFLTIDVEGVDFNVLKSNNWNKYKPNYIIVEIKDNNIETLINHKIAQYLKQKKYIIFAKTVNTVFFKYSS